jgi:hypothetical protein
MRRLAALGLGTLVVFVLVVAQLVLPGIAAQHLRDQLSRSGQVLSVEVRAFPAIKLLWHRADTVVVRLGDYRPKPGKLGSALDHAGDVGTLTASAREVEYGLLTLHDATLRKQGDRLIGTATVHDTDLRAAIPILSSVTPVASEDGRLTLQGTLSTGGLSLDATVTAQDGNLMVVPDVPLIGGLFTLKLFSDPHVKVQSVSATPVPGGFSVQGIAVLR